MEMSPVYTELLHFLKRCKENDYREEWADEVYQHIGNNSSTDRDPSGNEISGYYESLNENLEMDIVQGTFSFSDYLLKEYKDRIGPFVVSVHNMKSYQGLSNLQVNQNLKRMITEITDRLGRIKVENPYVYEALRSNVHSLIRGLTKLKIATTTPSRKSEVFQGFRLTLKSLQNNEIKFLNGLFDGLKEKVKLDERDRNKFISLFTEDWKGHRIEWLGKANEFWSLYDVLFKNIDDQTILIKKNGKRNTTTFVRSFIVTNDEGKPIAEIREGRYNSRPKDAPFLKNILIPMIQTLLSPYP